MPPGLSQVSSRNTGLGTLKPHLHSACSNNSLDKSPVLKQGVIWFLVTLREFEQAFNMGGDTP